MAATTKTGKIASAMIAAGRGWGGMFNDKLADGRRSLKVWGWDDSDYRKAKLLLEQEGCKVSMVKTRTVNCGGRTLRPSTRLHVTE